MNEEQVRERLRALPRRERLAVLLYYADRLTPAEIAAVLDVDLETVDPWVRGFVDDLAREERASCSKDSSDSSPLSR